MAKGSLPKIARNKKIVELKAKMTFANLSKMFQISPTMVKRIYYRETKKQAVDNGVDKVKQRV